MSLELSCGEEFLASDRRRGDLYFEFGQVRLGFRGDRLFTSRVRDQNVGIAITDHVETSCRCLRFHEGCFCGHIWATLLQLEAEGLVAWPSRDLDLVRLTPNEFDARHLLPAKERISQGGPVDTASARMTEIPGWKAALGTLKRKVALPKLAVGLTARVGRPAQHWYTILASDNGVGSALTVRHYVSYLNGAGEWAKPIYEGLSAGSLVDRHDIRLYSLLRGQQKIGSTWGPSSDFSIPPELQDETLQTLSDTRRFVWTKLDGTRLESEACHPIRWDQGMEWQVVLRGTRVAEAPQMIEFSPELERGTDRCLLSHIVAVYSDGLVLLPDVIARLSRTHDQWIHAFRAQPSIEIPESDLGPFIQAFSELPDAPRLELPADIQIQTELGVPQGIAELEPLPHRRSVLSVRLMFEYGDSRIGIRADGSAFWSEAKQVLMQRDRKAERRLLGEIENLYLRYSQEPGADFELDAASLSGFVTGVASVGWKVFAYGKHYRTNGSFNIHVQRDNDWFDLQADCQFQGVSSSLPAILKALQQRQGFVELDDGSYGILPEEWMQRFAPLAGMGEVEEDRVRFTPPQALLLDALLAEQENVSVDRYFTELVGKLKNFSGISPADPPATFSGQLRNYQREGVGWLTFLRDFGFGGCLADDMGLGKTIQVLAMLEQRRVRRLKKGEARRPSIAVVPKSLIFNWIDEGTKFTPKLRIVNYTGSEREGWLEDLRSTDLLITTYGTLRRDISQLSDLEFDYVILDEAQAIKNRDAQATKACRLLRSKYRLAMTGTPIENHVGELWSLMDFLNPGVLGASNAFKQFTAARSGDHSAMELLGKTLRPFILRRTKAQVLTELPEKTEQTLYCEMTPKQKKLYDDLRNHYRAHLAKKVDELGMKRSKIHVLEALLRLRQAACDPRLLDSKQKPGAKLETLFEQLAEVLQENHKVLIFSQFTSMLALVRQGLDKGKLAYAYLDGQTRDRRSCVERFQNDPECQIFLISLKAGGHGLNLTAADYVFILDPWWNPAVEAQAIDRAHRLGQQRSVTAYRLICRDTVEDKILQLQQSKRELADAIISGANESLIGELSADDLQLLLG